MRVIGHFSPSQINLWKANPVLWCVRYLKGVKEDTSPAMLAGQAIEQGLVSHFEGADPEEATADALSLVREDWPHWWDADTLMDWERHVATSVTTLCAKLPRPEWFAWQQLVAFQLPGCGIPVKGYIDFRVPSGVLELKSTRSKQWVRKPREDAARQVALYAYATGTDPMVAYVGGDRFSLFHLSDDEVRVIIEDAAAVARDMEEKLSWDMSDDDLIRSLPMGLMDYRWSEKTLHEALRIRRGHDQHDYASVGSAVPTF